MKSQRSKVKGSAFAKASADRQVDVARRTFIKAAGTSTAAVLMSGLPAGWVGSAFAQDGPEVTDMRFGIIALTDCAPIVMAHGLGHFKNVGIKQHHPKEDTVAGRRPER